MWGAICHAISLRKIRFSKAKKAFFIQFEPTRSCADSDVGQSPHFAKIGEVFCGRKIGNFEENDERVNMILVRRPFLLLS